MRPRFYRPPYWSWNDLTAREAGKLGMVGVLFSVDTGDWKRPGTEAIIRAALTAKAGDVIAFHDAGGDRSQTVDAIASIVVGLRKLGPRARDPRPSLRRRPYVSTLRAHGA